MHNNSIKNSDCNFKVNNNSCTAVGLVSDLCTTSSTAGQFIVAHGLSELAEKKLFISKEYFKNYTIPGSIKYIDFKHSGEVKEVYIKEVLYSDPATVVFWSDNTKTTCKVDSYDTYSPYAGLAICVLKKMYGNDEVSDLIDTWTPTITELEDYYISAAKTTTKVNPIRKTLSQIRNVIKSKTKKK